MVANRGREAIFWRGGSVTYGRLEDDLREWRSRIQAAGLTRQAVVVLEADFSPAAISALIALIEAGCVVVPVLRSTRGDRERIYRTALAGHRLCITDTEDWTLETVPYAAEHPLYRALHELDHPGLVLFTSGTSGDTQ